MMTRSADIDFQRGDSFVMAITPMKLKLQATRAVLREKDIARLEEEQLPKELPKTLQKELAQLVKMRAGKYRVYELFTKAARSDGLELTADMWERVRGSFPLVQVGDEVETRWSVEEEQQVWAMHGEEVGGDGTLAYMNFFLWGERINKPGKFGYGSLEDGRMVERWWELRQEAAQRLALVIEVYVDTKDNLVVKWEESMIVERFIGLGKEDEKVEIKVTVAMKFRKKIKKKN